LSFAEDVETIVEENHILSESQVNVHTSIVYIPPATPLIQKLVSFKPDEKTEKNSTYMYCDEVSMELWSSFPPKATFTNSANTTFRGIQKKEERQRNDGNQALVCYTHIGSH